MNLILYLNLNDRDANKSNIDPRTYNYTRAYVPVSMRMESCGNWNLLMRRYFMHLASLMHPLSSCREYLYDIPHITAFFLPCAFGGGPGGAWLYGDGAGGSCGAGECDGYWEGGGGTLRGSATCVMARQMAHRMDGAPGGSCNCAWQLEQVININMAGLVSFWWRV
jgi:hypothetical protein